MTAKGELTAAQRRRLHSAVRARARAEAHERDVIAELVEATAISAVARELGISRQAVQARLRAGQARRA